MLENILKLDKTLLTVLFFSIFFGIYSYSSLPREADPDISLPVIYISLIHQGISPEDSQRLLIKPMEKELKNIEGVKKMSSKSFLGGGSIMLEFDAGFNAKEAVNDTRVKVDLVKNKLPNETEEPIVTEVNLSRFPVLALAVSGNFEDRVLIKITKDLKNRIENIPEVLEVKTIGENERQIEIIVNPRSVKSYGLTAKDVLVSLQAGNILIPAGSLSGMSGSFNLKVPGLFENIDDLLKLPIKSNNKSVITLGEIADIKDTFKEIEGFARNNGKKAIVLEVSKRTGENIIETIKSIKNEIKFYSDEFSNELKIDFFQDESKAINSMISDLENNVILAILIVSLIIIYSMGKKSAMLVGISIPGSFLISMIFLSFLGVTINIVVLFSLILSVGILIDGTIIVVEYANRRTAEGISKKEVFIISAQKMSTPVIASTLTTLSAFFPLIFWPGIAGEFMYYLPITLLTILTSSLLMALIFIPVLGSFFGSDNPKTISERKNLILLETGKLSNITGIQKYYINILNICLNNPFKILISTIFLLFLIQIFYSKFGKGFEFFPPIEPDYAEVVVHARGNFSAYEKDKIVKQVEEIVIRNKFIENSYSYSGNIKGGRKEGADDKIGSIKIEFINWKKRPEAKKIISDLQKKINQISGIKVEIIEKKDGPPVDKDIEIELSNKNKNQLINDSNLLLNYLKKNAWVKNLDEGINIPGIEWELIVDRSEADKQGVDILTIGNAIQMITQGYKITEFMPEDSDEEVDIVVKFDKKYKNLDELNRIEIQGINGPIPLSRFVKRKAKSKIGKITRVDSKNSQNIKFDITSNLIVNNKVNEIIKWIDSNKNSFSSTIKFRGQEEDQEEAKKFLIKAFFISIFLITLILITTFESFYYSFIVLTSVIMSTIGVMIGLILTNQPFGIVMSGIGIIALAGIVVNNNIVLLDTYKRIKTTSTNIKEAIIRTGAQRLRPVLLTTLTTFFGLIPMAAGININFFTQEINFNSPSSQWWLQLSNAIVFGITFSFILTLVVTPCLILIGEKIQKKFQSFLK